MVESYDKGIAKMTTQISLANVTKFKPN